MVLSADGLPSDWTQDFPALCMHRHAWPVHTLRQLLGVHYTAGGLEIRPALPSRLGAFEWSTRLSSLRWDGNRTWTGHYAPHWPDLDPTAAAAAAAAAAEEEEEEEENGRHGRQPVMTMTLRVDMRHILPADTPFFVSALAASAGEAAAALPTKPTSNVSGVAQEQRRQASGSAGVAVTVPVELRRSSAAERMYFTITT